MQDRERLQAALAWPADSAGGLMNPETVSVRPDVNVDVVLRYLRMRGELPVNTDSVFVVDREDRYLGVLTFARLLTSDPEAAVTASWIHRWRPSRPPAAQQRWHANSRIATSCRRRSSTVPGA